MINLEEGKKKRVLSYLASFLLGSFCMLVTLWISNLIFGKYSLIKGDVMYNYIPAIRDFCRDIMSGNSIFYTWTYGLGTNTSLYNAYYSFSPLNILYLIFYKCDMNAVTAVCIVLKTGLAALCFNYFVDTCYEVDVRYAVLFSVFYSMCSYQIAFNIHNIIWLDAMYVLPMVFAAVHKLVAEHRTGNLVFWFAYIFISQFYMGYMIGIISVAYFLVCVYSKKREKAECSLLYVRFAVAVLFAICITAVLWLPALMFIITNSAEAGLQGFSSLKANLVDVYNQLFWGEVSNFDAAFPYIFCGTPVLFLVPTFWLNKSIEKKVRTGFGIVVAFLLVSCIITPVYAMWHGFDEPDLYAYRFSYIISFILCLMSVVALKHIDDIKVSWIILLYAVNVLIYIVEMFWQKSRYDQSIVSNSVMAGVVNLVLCIAWIGLICWYKSKNTEPMIKNFIAGIMILLAAVEMTANAYVILEYKGGLNSAYDINHFRSWEEVDGILTDALTQDESLYRVDMIQDMNPGAGTYWGANTMSYFCSAENVELRKTLSKLGLWSTPRMVTGHGLTPVTDMLLGVKYRAYGAIPTDDGNYTLGIDANDYALSMGYLVSEDILSVQHLDKGNAFENNNYLISAMVGRSEDVFKKVDASEIEKVAEGIQVEESEGLITYSLSESDGGHFVKYIIANADQRLIYGSVINETSFHNPNTFRIVDKEAIPVNTNGALTVSYIKSLYMEDNDSVLEISAGGNSSQQEVGGICFYELDENVLDDVYNELANGQLIINDYKDGYIDGNITVSGKKVLFTSIPYDKGWKVYVDGKKTETESVAEGTFLALRIEENGEHDVVFRYTPAGLIFGAFVSIFGLLGYFFWCRKAEY